MKPSSNATTKRSRLTTAVLLGALLPALAGCGAGSKGMGQAAYGGSSAASTSLGAGPSLAADPALSALPTLAGSPGGALPTLQAQGLTAPVVKLAGSFAGETVTTLQAQVDTVLAAVDNTWYGQDNLIGNLAWSESEVIEAYLAAYQRMRDVKYLDKVARHLDMVLMLRDSNINVYHPKQILGGAPVWPSTLYSLNKAPYAWAVHTGILAKGLAQFAVLVKQDNVTKHATRAATYLNAAKQALQYHEREFVLDGDGGYYVNLYGAPVADDGVNLPSNMNLAMAMAEQAVYMASGETKYRDRAIRLAKTFKRTLRLSAATGSYAWNYTFGLGYNGWGAGVSKNTPTSTGTRSVEDFSHGALDVQAARYLYDGNTGFTKADMQCFANTCQNVMLASGSLSQSVDGTDGLADPQGKLASWLVISTWQPLLCSRVYNQLSTVPVSATMPTWAARGWAMLLQAK